MSADTIVNVAKYLPNRAKSHPNQCALKVPVGQVGNTLLYDEYTFAQLESLSNGVCWHLMNQGVVREARVLMMVRPGLELILITFALFKIGAVPVIIDPGMGIKRFLSCVKQTKPEVLVGIPMAIWASRLLGPAFNSVRSRVVVKEKDFVATIKKLVEPFPVTPTSADDDAAILFTSGSTGTPKGVLYKHGVFETQIEEIRGQYEIQPGEVDLPMLPIFALFNPAMGMTTVVPQMNPSRPAKADPAKIVRAIQQNEVTNSFGSPVLWGKIAQYCILNGISLPTVKRILMGGTAVPPSLIKKCKDVFPNAEVHTPYGATEVLPVSSISGEEVLEKTVQLTESGKGLCVGKPFDSVKLLIVEPEDKPIGSIDECRILNRHEVGEIIIKGPLVTESYNNALTATLEAKIVDGDKVWHRMGDLGYLDDEDRLWICGRKVERLTTKNGPMYTDCCEAIMNKHPHIYRSALIGLGEKGNETPVFLIQPISEVWPNSADDKKGFLQAIKGFAKLHSQLASIDHFYLEKDFPVDVRHNAKIHRLTLKRKYEKLIKV